MFYVVVNADELRKIGLKFFRKMPDGRGIAAGPDLKAVGELKNVDVYFSEEALKAEIEKQKNEMKEV